MDETVLVTDAAGAVPVRAVRSDALEAGLAGLGERERRFAAAAGFRGEAGRLLLVPDADGDLALALYGLGGAEGDHSPLSLGRLATLLPGERTWRLEGHLDDPALSALAFGMGAYRFGAYRKSGKSGPRLLVPERADAAALRRTVDAVTLVRDLVNTPANDLSPRDLAAAAETLAARHGADIAVIEGAALEEGFPMVHAVGAGSDRPPCLVDMRWGRAGDPAITLVGKGIVFDTGGLDIKPSAAMLTMKKDMGGAANVLGLAAMIMGAGLKVRLRVIIPAAENSISGRAFRPGDILRSRKGLTVEIGNTDAEGRLVLADALALADEEAPSLIVTMATLTGAARVALGPELPPFFTDDEDVAAGIAASAAAVHDPVWRLPFWNPYDSWLSSKVADLNHIASNAFAGSIVAALFLRRFVSAAQAYAHFDIFAWNPGVRPHGPEGGEAQAIRALFHFLQARHG